MTNLPIHHDPILVALSFIVAIFTAYAALTTINRLRQGGGQGWLVLGAITFGLGVWAMHFTAMTALNLGVLIGYNPALTLLSVVFAIVGAAIAFNLVRQPQVGFARVLGAGTALGAGIGVMHYTGMYAMRMDAYLNFSLPMVGLSVVVAVVLGTFGIWLLTTPALSTLPARNLLAATVTGLAIPLMHYTAMLAAHFSADPNAITHTSAYAGLLSVNLLLLAAVGVVSLPMFLTSLLGNSEEIAESSQGA